MAFTRAKECLILVPQDGEDLSALFPDGFTLDPAPTAPLRIQSEIPTVGPLPKLAPKPVSTPLASPLPTSVHQSAPEPVHPLIYQTLERKAPYQPGPPFELPRLASSVNGQTQAEFLAPDRLKMPSSAPSFMGEFASFPHSTPVHPPGGRRPTSLQGLLSEASSALRSEKGQLERLEADFVRLELQPPDTPLREFSSQHYRHLIAGVNVRIKKWGQKVDLYSRELGRSESARKIEVS